MQCINKSDRAYRDSFSYSLPISAGPLLRLMNLSVYPDFSESLFRKNQDLIKQNLDHFLAAVDRYIDIIKIGDKLSTQDRLMISPKMCEAY